MPKSTPLAAVLLLVSLPAMAQTPTPSPAETRGTAIGTTIKAAIDAALPGVTTIGTVIKNLFGKDANNDDSKKLKVSDVQKQLNDQKADLQKASNAKLAQLSSVVAEIEITNDLGKKARLASADLTVIRSYIYMTVSPTTEIWERIKHEWTTNAKGAVADVVKFDPERLKKVSDEDVQKELKALGENNSRTIGEIDDALTNADRAGALAAVTTLGNRMDNLSQVSAVQLSSFGNQLAALASNKPADKPKDLSKFLQSIK
jgi:hypothetical protein